MSTILYSHYWQWLSINWSLYPVLFLTVILWNIYLQSLCLAEIFFQESKAFSGWLRERIIRLFPPSMSGETLPLVKILPREIPQLKESPSWSTLTVEVVSLQGTPFNSSLSLSTFSSRAQIWKPNPVVKTQIGISPLGPHAWSFSGRPGPTLG